jgi:RNA polymerase sigma factor (TIGR02999 family)
MRASEADVTGLLIEWSKGSEDAFGELISVVHRELHRLAREHMRRERPGHTLQPTALVNEAYIRLVDQKRAKWENRAQFFGVAAKMMRRILVDQARKRKAARRGGGAPPLPFDESIASSRGPAVNLPALDEALQQLEAIDPRQSRVVELKYFGGLSIEEIARVLDISPATVVREWATAKAWLGRELGKESK